VPLFTSGGLGLVSSGLGLGLKNLVLSTSLMVIGPLGMRARRLYGALHLKTGKIIALVSSQTAFYIHFLLNNFHHHMLEKYRESRVAFDYKNKLAN